nr:hypothetical protein Itr_chr09CG12890 [Ipomoea trifida]
MQQITRKELVRLSYGYVFNFLRNNEVFLYEPIDQVRGANQRRNGNRRGRPVQGGHIREHFPQFNLNDEVHMEADDDQRDAPRFGQDVFETENKMGDITQKDVTQPLMPKSPFMTPYVPQLHVYEEGSSSQVLGHVGHPIRILSNQMPNAPFEHPIQSYYNEDATINTSQVVNSTKPQEVRGLV